MYTPSARREPFARLLDDVLTIFVSVLGMTMGMVLCKKTMVSLWCQWRESTETNMVPDISSCSSEVSFCQQLQPSRAVENTTGEVIFASLKQRSTDLNGEVRRTMKVQQSLKKKLKKELRRESREQQEHLEVAFVLLVRHNGDVTRSLEYLKQVETCNTTEDRQKEQKRLDHRSIITPLLEVYRVSEGGGPLKRKAFTMADKWQA